LGHGTSQAGYAYVFLEFTLDVVSERLLRGATELKLRPKSFQTLRHLVENHGRLISRDELMQAVWGDVAVTDESITKCIADIRKALADDSHAIVRTVTCRGFLFQAEVRAVPAIQLEDQMHAPTEGTVRALPRWPVRAIVPLIAIGVITAFVGHYLAGHKAHQFASRPAYEAIAVLPFEPLSAGEDQRYLGDGITEAVITSLGEISPLRVVARTSVNQYQGTKKPIQQIARELKVDAVVEGTITQSGDRLRITANLIQVSPEKHLWAHSYERQFSDVLALEDEIAESIAAEIQGRVAPSQQGHREISHPLNPEAQLAFWKAEYLMSNMQGPDDVRKIIEYAEQAVRLDPNYAPAQAALSRSYFLLASVGFVFPRESMPRARMAAEQAIALNERLAYGHFVLGSIFLIYDRNWAAAEREARRAIALNPSDAQGHLLLANYFAAIGRTDEAVIEAKRARELDPLSFHMNWMVGRLLCLARRFDEALAELKQARDMHRSSSPIEIFTFKSYWMKGQVDEAIAADLRLRAFRDGLSAQSLNALRAVYASKGSRGYWMKLRELLQPRFRTNPIGWYRLAEINTYAGEKEEALRWLQKAYDERADWIPFLKVDPTLDPLRPDPRFQALLRGMGLSP
jgi:TolB-like protein/DNA-binding winged helix-turn-helix (wHTH) protein